MTLWTSEQISEATGGKVTAEFSVTGLSIDTRSLKAGDLFVALKDAREKTRLLLCLMHLDMRISH